MEDAGRKKSDVAQEMERTLKLLEDKEGGRCSYLKGLLSSFADSHSDVCCFPPTSSSERFKHKAEFLLQKGRCLNVTPDFSAVAEECLSRAVKLEPGLVEAWNTLGEQYWKKEDLVGAKNCFNGALQQVIMKQLQLTLCGKFELYITSPLSA